MVLVFSGATGVGCGARDIIWQQSIDRPIEWCCFDKVICRRDGVMDIDW